MLHIQRSERSIKRFLLYPHTKDISMCEKELLAFVWPIAKRTRDVQMLLTRATEQEVVTVFGLY